MKNLYQGLEMEVVAFGSQDIVTLSDNVAADIFKPNQQTQSFTPENEAFS